MAWAITTIAGNLSVVNLFESCAEPLSELAESYGLHLADMSEIELVADESPVIFGKKAPHEVQDVVREWNRIADDELVDDVLLDRRAVCIPDRDGNVTPRPFLTKSEYLDIMLNPEEYALVFICAH